MPALFQYVSLAAACAAPLLCAAQAYEDWTVQCDNVNRCEAVGYGPDRGTARWLAVQLVRDAGPATEVKAKVIVAGNEEEKPIPITMTVDHHRPIALRANETITRETAQRLLERMVDGREGQASEGRQHWSLPLAGMKAALLRMDALQGRIGTPGALVLRGKRPEAAVPPAPAMPVLRAVPPAKPIDDPAIKAALVAEIGHGGENGTDYHGLFRLADGRLLLLLELDRGPTSSFHEIWLANGPPPYRPRELDLSTNGLPGDALVNADFDGQVLGAYTGRTLADCAYAAKWLWTGDRFELLALNRADHCRGMLDLVEHRKWVARKIPSPSTQ